MKYIFAMYIKCIQNIVNNLLFLKFAEKFYNSYDVTLFLQLLVYNISHYSLIVRLKFN